MSQEQFFKGLKVVELASVLAGPAVGMFFAELGAEVIKIENKRTGGDITRQWKLKSEDEAAPLSAYYHSVNYGKHGLMMDLRSAEEMKIVMGHVRDADIVISNFKPTSARNLGIDYDSLREERSDLIYATITAYGEEDDTPGFDAMIQAETGWIHMTGTPEGGPAKMPVALIDIMAAHQLKEAILLALLKKAKTGEGSHVTVSLFDASVASLANQASNYLNEGYSPQRIGTQHPNIAPYGDTFHTQDGKMIILGVGTEKQFANLCKVLKLEELLVDPKFRTNYDRVKNREQLCEVLRGTIARFTSEVLITACRATEVTIARVNDLPTLFSDPKTRDLLLSGEDGEGRVVKTVRTAVFKFLD